MELEEDLPTGNHEGLDIASSLLLKPQTILRLSSNLACLLLEVEVGVLTEYEVRYNMAKATVHA